MKDICNYDFSGKRVRYCGRVLDKFSVAYHIDSIKPYALAIIRMDVLKYSDLADELKTLLS